MTRAARPWRPWSPPRRTRRRPRTSRMRRSPPPTPASWMVLTTTPQMKRVGVLPVQAPHDAGSRTPRTPRARCTLCVAQQRGWPVGFEEVGHRCWSCWGVAVGRRDGAGVHSAMPHQGRMATTHTHITPSHGSDRMPPSVCWHPSTHRTRPPLPCARSCMHTGALGAEPNALRRRPRKPPSRLVESGSAAAAGRLVPV